MFFQMISFLQVSSPNRVNISVLLCKRHMPRTSHPYWFYKSAPIWCVAPSGRAVKGTDLRPLAYWDFGFEFRRGHACQFRVGVLCFQVRVSIAGWSVVRGSPTECGAPVSIIVRPHKGRPWPGIGNKMIFGEDY